MGRRKKGTLPSYHDKQSGQAYVWLNGKQVLLGKHGTPASWAAYHRTCLNAALARSAIWGSACSVSFSRVGMASLAAGPIMPRAVMASRWIAVTLSSPID